MILNFYLITKIFSKTYPLELCFIDKNSDGNFVRLAINVDTPYSLSLCYNKNIKDKENWKSMIDYECDEGFVEINAYIPDEGDYKMFYSFRLTNKSGTSFCQPFYYEKNQYKVVEKDYKKKLSEKIKEEEDGDDKNDDDEILLHWFGFILVGFILSCLVGIFVFNADSVFY